MGGWEIWIVSALLYLFDSARQGHTRVVLRYALEGTSARLVDPTLSILGRPFHLPNPLRPDICDFPLTHQGRDGRLSELEGYFIRRGASLYIWHQIASVAVLLILFGLTPILAQKIYLPFACAISVLTADAICALQWTLMWHDRFILGIDGKVLRAEMLHVLLCPPNAINTTRRLAGRRRMRFDAKTVLRKFSRLDAETYEAQFLGVTPANA